MSLSLKSVCLPRQLLRHWVGGRDAWQREHVRRLGRRFWLNAVASVLMGISAVLGLTQAWAAGVTMAYSWAGLAVFYTLLRSGASQRWTDPSLTFAQLIFAISSVVVSYGLVDIARGAALQLMCLLLAFEMDRLTRRQLLRASLLAVAMLCLTSLGRVLIEPQQVQVAVELYDLVMATVLLPAAIMIGGEIGRLHRRVVVQREELARTLAQLSQLSWCDALTGLSNRRQMMSLLEQEQQRQQRGGQPWCVALIDIDWFKRVNDSHGHGVGDAVLRQFAAVCGSTLRPGDTLARWGGEEFLLLMPAGDEQQALDVLGQLRLAVAASDWSALASGLKVSFSAGVVQCVAAASLVDVLEAADRALYRAKNAGRDRCVAERLRGAPVASSRSPAAVPAPRVWVDQAQMRGGGPLQGRAGESARPLPAARLPAAVDAAASQPRSRSPWQRLWDLVMSADPVLREHLRLPMIAYALHMVWMAAVLWYAMPAEHIGAFDGQVVVFYELASVAGFYLLIRCGLTRRLGDPSLVLVQMIAACLIVGYGYAVAPTLRPSLLHLMCVIQIFGMVTLRPRASRAAGAGAVLVLLVVLAGELLGNGDAAQRQAEVLKIALACFIVGRLSMLSHQYSQVRESGAAEQQQLASAVAQVQELVVRDALTGLFNRRHMQDLLAHESERFSRTGVRFCVALIDVDHFKRVNDTYGHQTGDEVLVGVAQAAQQALRSNDVICRWGGEEFLVLMRDTDPALQGLVALSRLRQHVSQSPAPSQAPGLVVTFSAGLATPRAGETLEQTLARADQAMYAAKAAGRNRDVVAEEPAPVVWPSPCMQAAMPV